MKATRRLAWALGLLTCTVGGCGAYRYDFKTGRPPAIPAQSVTETRHLAFWGWMSGPPFDLEQACPQGVAEFGSRVSFLNWLPAFLTLGLYTPRTVYAVCAQSEAAP